MHMTFWFGTELKDFLFNGYNIISAWGLVSTCLGLSALAVLYEAMKLFQIKLHKIMKAQNQVSSARQNTDSSSLISRVSENSVEMFGSIYCFTWVKWFAEVFHWAMHVTLGYILMLTVMTYNGYISIALVLGSGIGYYIFGPILIDLNISKIQKRRRLMECNPVCADAIISRTRRESSLSTISEHAEVGVNINVNVDIHN